MLALSKLQNAGQLLSTVRDSLLVMANFFLHEAGIRLILDFADEARRLEFRSIFCF
jgi:hypothetical protein